MDDVDESLLTEISARYPDDADVLTLVSEVRNMRFRVFGMVQRLQAKANAEAERDAAVLRAEREVTRRILMHAEILDALGEHYVPPADPIESLREVATNLKPLAKCGEVKRG